MLENSPPFFIAYVFAGWHVSSYRPTLEWPMLSNFKPYFKDHQPPAHPSDGEYDDSYPRLNF